METVLANILMATLFIAGLLAVTTPTLGITHNWDYFSKPENKSDLKFFVILSIVSAILTGFSVLIFMVWPKLFILVMNRPLWMPFLLFGWIGFGILVIVRGLILAKIKLS